MKVIESQVSYKKVLLPLRVYLEPRSQLYWSRWTTAIRVSISVGAREHCSKKSDILTGNIPSKVRKNTRNFNFWTSARPTGAHAHISFRYTFEFLNISDPDFRYTYHLGAQRRQFELWQSMVTWNVFSWSSVLMKKKYLDTLNSIPTLFPRPKIPQKNRQNKKQTDTGHNQQKVKHPFPSPVFRNHAHQILSNRCPHVARSVNNSRHCW